MKKLKKGFKLFRETEKIGSFRSFAYFHYNLEPSLRVLYLLFEFRAFYSSCVPFSSFILHLLTPQRR